MGTDCSGWCFEIAMVCAFIVGIVLLFLLRIFIERGGGCSGRVFMRSLKTWPNERMVFIRLQDMTMPGDEDEEEEEEI